jgi:hypothetical protein
MECESLQARLTRRVERSTSTKVEISLELVGADEVLDNFGRKGAGKVRGVVRLAQEASVVIQNEGCMT